MTATRSKLRPRIAAKAYPATGPEYVCPACGAMTAITSPSRSGSCAVSKYPSTLRASTSGSASYQRPARGEGRTSRAIVFIVALSGDHDETSPGDKRGRQGYQGDQDRDHHIHAHRIHNFS